MYRQDQAILDIQNEDEDDFGRRAIVKASWQTEDGPASNVIDGFNRDVSDGKTHQWRAPMQDGQPWIELSWNKPVRVGQIQLIFDTGLNRFLRISPEDSVYRNQERGPQPETVSDYTIEAIHNNKRTVLATVRNNYLRRVVHAIEPMEAEAIRITVQKTNGDPFARIFEVRCYEDTSQFL